ncbi:MAG: glycosyltransferase family 2 protein [bacterium]|nr:glycosyltransferase family 2 protein [bacterium]
MSTRPSKKIRDKYTPKDSNICVVVYATGKVNTLDNLIKQLKNQNYPKQNYTIYAILDKCTDVSDVTLQTETNVNVISVDNMEPIGKSQAYSIIAEKLYEVPNLDAYLFLDAKNYVDIDFLANVNYYLTKSDVFNPMINYLPQENKLTIWQNMKSMYSRYCDKFIKLSRTKLGLTNIIDTNAFVIKKDILNKIADFNFRDIFSEVNYTLKLAKEGVKVDFIDDLKVYTSIDNFEFRIPSLTKRIALLWNNFFKVNGILPKEFLLSLAVPNWLTSFIGYVVLLNATIIPIFNVIDSSFVFITSLILILAFCVSLMAPKFYPNEFLYLALYPAYSIWRMIYNFPPIRGIRNIIKQTTRKHVIETMTTEVIVTDGTREFRCQMEMISDDGLAKVTFINNGKKYTTKNNHLRMIDAVRELTTKLKDYGLTLKVCQCCKYFQPVVDGSTNMVKGCCNCQFQGRTPGDIIPTLIWNTCPNYEEQNIIPLF